MGLFYVRIILYLCYGLVSNGSLRDYFWDTMLGFHPPFGEFTGDFYGFNSPTFLL